jgi:ankyrin repeat protein
MDCRKLPARPTIERFEKLAERQQHLNPTLTLAAAQRAVAKSYGFKNWLKFSRHIKAVASKNSLIPQFETAVEAVVSGHVDALARLLQKNPDLIHARSTREHQSTLLHYVSANGVEDHRQKTPKNAVDVANLLLNAGADVDAVADAYGKGTTLGLVATSIHPVIAGVQIALLETLLKHGASVNGAPNGWNPLIAALHNGRPQAAEFLAKRGANLDLEGAAGVGRLHRVKELFSESTKKQIEDGFMWACEYGRTSVVRFLLKMEVNISAQPNGETGLHWAAYGGHLDIVRLLLKRKAPLGVKVRTGPGRPAKQSGTHEFLSAPSSVVRAVFLRDKRFDATPLGWALHGWRYPSPEGNGGGHYEIVESLVAAGASVDGWWLHDTKVLADERMQAALHQA